MGPSVETIAKITYNDHSDKSDEHSTTISPPDPSQVVQPGAPFSAQKVENRYSYKYDKFGNWTEQATSAAASPNDVTVIRRTIIYY
jgi:hypothetical protein